MAFRWRAVDGPLIVVFGSFLSSSLNKLKKTAKKKTLSKLDPLWQNFLDLRMLMKLYYGASSSFSSGKYMTTCNFPGGGLGPLPPLPLCLRPYQSFKQFEFTIVRYFRDFLYQRVPGHMYCRAWSIHKPSANYIS